MKTIREWVNEATLRLQRAGVESARLDARLLAGVVLGGGVERVLAEDARRLLPEEEARLAALLARREAREPLSQILGVREFWGRDFRVTAATLTPRPDTETVIEAVLDRFPDRGAPLRVLDLGTGTGCLLLTLLGEYPAATGLGVDASGDALAVARDNADRLGFSARARFRPGDWCEGVDETFDLVVANPPYIPAGDIPGLMPEVSRHEPQGALLGGADGLDAYRAIIPALCGKTGVLKAGGQAFFEIGLGQEGAVGALLARAGFGAIGTRADLGGRIRCVFAVCQG